jgi:hypothetical protein
LVVWLGYRVVDWYGEKKKTEGRQQGQQEEKAAHAAEAENLNRYKRSFDERRKAMKEEGDFFKHLAALFAVAAAVSGCDGQISQEERDGIREWIKETMPEYLPEYFRRQIDEFLSGSPPSFGTAMEWVEKAESEHLITLIDGLIEHVILLDGEEVQAETDFRLAWEDWKASR